MPIVEPLLWLAVASLLIAFVGLLRENIRLKRECDELHRKRYLELGARYPH